MFNSKYSTFLTILLVVSIIAILGVIGYLGYDIYKKYYTNIEAEEAISQFDTTIEIEKEENKVEENTDFQIEGIDETQEEEQNTETQNQTQSQTKYKGYNMMGYIEIPKISIKYPVLEKVTKKSIQVAVAILDGPGLNKVGNTLIIGHNYRNGLFFSNLKKLSNGDTIYITDLSGTKVKYTVYSVYNTDQQDITYMSRDTANRREISLSTCSDDGSERTVVWAKADE